MPLSSVYILCNMNATVLLYIKNIEGRAFSSSVKSWWFKPRPGQVKYWKIGTI